MTNVAVESPTRPDERPLEGSRQPGAKHPLPALFSGTIKLGTMVLCAINLFGCAHLTADNHTASSSPQLPDWSGIWVLTFYGGGSEAGRDSQGPDGQGNVPVTARYAQLREAAIAAQAPDNLDHCLPAGATAVLQHGILYEFLFTPGRVTLLFEDGEVRRIHTDGRPHKSLSELSQSFMGDSIGHWDGQTLVVDTIGFPKGQLWQNGGIRATKDTHLVEKIYLNAQGEIQIDNTLTDPAVFTKPYIYSRHYKRTTLPLDEPVCAQNNRDTGTDIDLTPPEE